MENEGMEICTPPLERRQALQNFKNSQTQAAFLSSWFGLRRGPDKLGTL